METLQKCLQSLKKSKSDNEKLAALMVISKLTQSTNTEQPHQINTSNITKDIGGELFAAVSTQFLLRLLRSSSENDSNAELFHQLALDVLSVVARSDPNVITIKNDEDTIVIELLKLLNSPATKVDETQNIIELLTMIFPRERRLNTSSEINMVQIGVNHLIGEEVTTSERAETFLSLLLSTEIYKDDTANTLLGYSEVLVNNQDIEKFNQLATISRFMKLLHKLEYKSELFDKKIKMAILKNIHSATHDLLRSRIKAEYKRLALSLVSSVIQVFGIDWIFDVSGKEASKSCLLILISVSVELAWLLNRDTTELELLARETDFVIGCFEVTKSFLVCLCSDKFEDNALSKNSSFIVNMFNTFKNIMVSVYNFLQASMTTITTTTTTTVQETVSEENEDIFPCLDDPLTVQAISLICIWATEETESLQDELKEVIPFMLKVGKKKMAAKMDGFTAEATEFFSSLVPCIAQLIPDEEIRKTLLKNDCLSLLQDVFINTMENSDKSHQLLECLVHVFHEAIILAPAYCKQTTWKQSLTDKLTDLHHRCLEKGGLFTLYSRFEMVAVLLRLYQVCGVRIMSMDKFLLSVVHFVLQAVEDIQDMDESYTDMWHVAVQSLIQVLSVNKSERNNLKSDPDIQRLMSNARTDVTPKSAHGLLLRDFQLVLYG